MVSLPFTGHVNPTLGMAKSLVDKGHTVDFILSDQWRKQVEYTGANFIPYDNFPKEPTALDLRRLAFKAACDTTIRIEGKYNCLIYEMLFFPGKSIADRLGIPAVRLFSTFALNDEIMKNIVATGGPLISLFKSKKVAKFLTNCLLGDVCVKEDNLISEITHNTPKLNFVFTLREFQVDQANFPEQCYKFIGPSIQGRIESPLPELDSFSTPLIYISLGSMLNNAMPFYKKCIKAFEYQPCTVIISVGKRVKISDFGNISPNIKIFPFVPQLKVLERASLFITHGGMNSVNEALYFGVPMMVMPLATDQPTIAKQIERLNLGRIISRKDHPANIRDAAFSVLHDPVIGSHMKEFSSISKKARGTNLAVEELEYFLKKNQRIIEKGE